ncbi:Hypothetical protein GQ85_004 [Rhodococcus rhodochrous]|nr:hypothetical protein [Rhodococcus rhodochrous]OOL33108.1 Hypothetical protein GQ85_004 [Rhodococcus rhodochrous]
MSSWAPGQPAVDVTSWVTFSPVSVERTSSAIALSASTRAAAVFSGPHGA